VQPGESGAKTPMVKAAKKKKSKEEWREKILECNVGDGRRKGRESIFGGGGGGRGCYSFYN